MREASKKNILIFFTKNKHTEKILQTLCKPKNYRKWLKKFCPKRGVDKKACIISCSQTYALYPQACV